jgi:uncharacterized damage-inducible protein DinB
VLLHHHLTQRAFLLVWTGRPLEFPEASSFATLDDVRAWARPHYREVESFLGALDAPALEADVVLPWASRLEARLGRTPIAGSLADTLLQVPGHSAHHRGQVVARLRELGREPPLVDYIAWVWLGQPPPDWA